MPPAKTSRRLQTIIECPAGQSVTLRGLKATHQTTSFTRLPVLGELPVLDSVFSKKRTESEEVEFVVLITAELVDQPPK